MKKIAYIIFACAAIISFLHFKTDAQTNDECLDCHNDPDITMERNGRTVSLEVKKYELARSVHSSLQCVDCHYGFDPYDIPHKENIEPINCKGCHGSPQESHRFHPQITNQATGVGGSPDVNCKGCHGTHEIKDPNDPKVGMNFYNSVDFCGKCHSDIKMEHMQSVHYTEVQHDNPNAPTCMFCHNKPITAGTKLNALQLKINTEKLCLDCHIDVEDNPSEFAKTLVKYEESVHGRAILKGNQDAAVCIDCHGVHKLQKESNPASKIHKSNVHNVCGQCHGSITDEYMESIHGAAVSRGIFDSPTCTNCHGEHDIHEVPHVPKQAFSESGMNFDVIVGNKMVWCVSCHSDPDMMKKYDLQTVEKAHTWLPVPAKHFKTVRCVDCHSSYDPPNMSHNVLPLEETVKQCEECHSKDSKLMTKLYVHEKQQSRDKYGFINGTLLSDAYITGATRNIYLEVFSYLIFGITIVTIVVHGTLRATAKRKKKKMKGDDKA
ncbi:MAG: cytochrome c3 family protein [Candidatus Kapaibacterium sp.]